MKINLRMIGLFLVLLAFSFVALKKVRCNSCCAKEIVRAEKLLNEGGEAMEPLRKLLNLLEVEHDGTLGGIVDATQKEWLRRAGKERWEVENKHEDKRDMIIPLLDQLNCRQEILPSKKDYQYAIVLGALVSRVRTRFAFLLEQWKSGIRFKEIVFFGGARPLHEKLETTKLLLDPHNKELPFSQDWQLESLPKTEMEMMRMVFDQADIPEAFAQAVRVTFIDAPMQQKADGTFRRPNTNDTVQTWLQTSPEPGSCLIVSNQPYVGWQDSVARTLLPKSFAIETVGSVAYEDLPIAIYLDTVARWLYQERRRRE